MSLHNTIRIIGRVTAILAGQEHKYTSKQEVIDELKKLANTLNNLSEYLSKLDKLQPNYTTNDVDQYMSNINLHLDFLKATMSDDDYQQIAKGIKVIKKSLKFHPSKYSFFEFIFMWFYELIYFI